MGLWGFPKVPIAGEEFIGTDLEVGSKEDFIAVGIGGFSVEKRCVFGDGLQPRLKCVVVRGFEWEFDLSAIIIGPNACEHQGALYQRDLIRIVGHREELEGVGEVIRDGISLFPVAADGVKRSWGQGGIDGYVIDAYGRFFGTPAWDANRDSEFVSVSWLRIEFFDRQ